MSDYPFSLREIARQGDSICYRIEPGGYTLSTGFKTLIRRVYSLEVRQDDVWLLGLPKSGTTWASELIWTVYHEANVIEARHKHHFQRWRVPETDAYYHKMKETKQIPEAMSILQNDSIDMTNQAPSPRFIKTHLPISLLPPNLLDTCKVVYIARDFRDCIVSLQHMMAGGSRTFPDTFEDGVKRFMTEKMFLYPWTSVLKEAWNQRNHNNMMFIFYEDMKKDLQKVIRELAVFLGKTLTDKQVETLQEHLSFNCMKDNESVNMSVLSKSGFMNPESNFIRKGTVGDWKNYFTPEQESQYNSWWEQNMEGCDFKFPDC